MISELITVHLNRCTVYLKVVPSKVHLAQNCTCINIQSLNIMSYIQTYIHTYIHTTCMSSWSVDMVFRSLETIQTLPYSALSTPLDNPLLIPALSSTHSHQRGETIDSLRHIPLFHPCFCLFRPVL